MTNTGKSFDYYRDMYLFYSETKEHKNKVIKSVDICSNYLLGGGVFSVNVSGGKDSMAMAHLVNLIRPGIKMVSEKDDLDFPGEIEYLNNVKSSFKWNLEIISPDVSLWENLKSFDLREDMHSKGTNFSETYFYGLLRDYQKRNAVDHIFLGLRCEESKGRLWNFKKNGHIYFNKSWGHFVCQPLALWKGKDVFAYLFSNDIPILDVYFKNALAEPEQIRKSWVIPSAQTKDGQMAWLKFYYPEIFNKLSKIQPTLRCFS